MASRSLVQSAWTLADLAITPCVGGCRDGVPLPHLPLERFGGVEIGRAQAIAMGLPIAWEGPLAPHHPFGTLSQAWWASSALHVKAAATIAFLVGKGREGPGRAGGGAAA